MVFGTICHHLIRLLKIDLKIPVFRFANHWNYYFRGEILSTKEFGSMKKGKWLSTSVDILIDDGTEKNKMVSGLLTQYSLSQKTGDLETIYLTSATKYSESTKRFKNIPGDCLIVPFDKIIDMNLRYTFQVLTPTQKKQIEFKNSVLAILTMGLLFSIICPWYFNAPILYKLLSVIFGGFSWTLFVLILSSPFQPNPNVKFTGKNLWLFFILMVIFLIITIFLLGIMPSILQIKNIF